MDNETVINNESMNTKSDIIKITGMGVRLKKARESMHLTEKEAAARLYLNPRIITAIESEAFADGPPITFLRGYLRSYARMLNLPENEIKAGLDELETIYPQHIPNKPALHATPINHNDRYIRWITYLIVSTLLVLVTLWWNSHSKYIITDVPNQTNEFSQESESTTTTTAPQAPSAAPPTATTQPVVPPAAPIATPPQEQPTPVAPMIIIRDAPIIQINANTPKKVKAAKNKSKTPSSSINESKKQEHKSVISNMALALPESGS